MREKVRINSHKWACDQNPTRQAHSGGGLYSVRIDRVHQIMARNAAQIFYNAFTDKCIIMPYV